MEPEEQVEQGEVENKKTNIGPIIAIAAIVLIIIVVFASGTFSKKAATQSSVLPTNISVQNENSQNTTASTEPTGPVKEFTVDGTNFAFNPNKITVNKGDTVKITFKDDDGAHNLVIPDYNVSTKLISEGSQDTIQFIADKAGTFEYFCSVGGHREAGMVGTLVVE